jgi:hypothetical protein
MIFMLPALVILFIACCDAPFIFLFFIRPLRRSLPGAKRRCTHLYVPFAIQQIKPLRHEDTKNYKALVLLGVFVYSKIHKLPKKCFRRLVNSSLKMVFVV